jgi:hypothetical protein
MTSITAEPTAPALPAPTRLLTALARFFALADDAIRTARAYEHADSAAARRRILDDFAKDTHPTA